MTFSKINESLPNGLHDAQLHGIQMDYVRRQLTFDLVLWIGEMDDRARREMYRPARLTFADVGFLCIEPPSNGDALPLDGPVTIDAGEGIPERISFALPSLEGTRSVTWIYVNDWNSYLLFSAGNGTMEWMGEEENWSTR